MAGNFKIGDLVWAKMKGFPAWPGKVIAPKIDVKRPAGKKNQQFVFFFGSENYAWIPEENIHDFPTHRSRFMLTQRIPRGYKEAIEAVEDALKSNPTEVSYKTSELPSIEEELAQIFPHRKDAPHKDYTREPLGRKKKNGRGAASVSRVTRDSITSKESAKSRKLDRVPTPKAHIKSSKVLTKAAKKLHKFKQDFAEDENSATAGVNTPPSEVSTPPSERDSNSVEGVGEKGEKTEEGVQVDERRAEQMRSSSPTLFESDHEMDAADNQNGTGDSRETITPKEELLEQAEGVEENEALAESDLPPPDEAEVPFPEDDEDDNEEEEQKTDGSVHQVVMPVKEPSARGENIFEVFMQNDNEVYDGVTARAKVDENEPVEYAVVTVDDEGQAHMLIGAETMIGDGVVVLGQEEEVETLEETVAIAQEEEVHTEEGGEQQEEPREVGNETQTQVANEIAKDAEETAVSTDVVMLTDIETPDTCDMEGKNEQEAGPLCKSEAEPRREPVAEPRDEAEDYVLESESGHIGEDPLKEEVAGGSGAAEGIVTDGNDTEQTIDNEGESGTASQEDSEPQTPTASRRSTRTRSCRQEDSSEKDKKEEVRSVQGDRGEPRPGRKSRDMGKIDTRMPSRRHSTKRGGSPVNTPPKRGRLLKHFGSPGRFGAPTDPKPLSGVPPDSIEQTAAGAPKQAVIPTPLKIGFLGLGIMGHGMVNNLIQTGHEVTVWNRTQQKCREFVKEGALKGNTPAEVVASCDITFSCVSDPAAVKDLVFGNLGVLQGIEPGKGFVDMSTIDADTVADVSEAVTARGGRYLEAPVVGSRGPATSGDLIILSAGDRTLYEDCYSCFEAIGKKTFFLGEVTSGAKMKLVVNMLMGTVVAGLAESLALADKVGLDQDALLQIFDLSALSCPLIHNKGEAIMMSRFEPQFPLQHQQKDLRLAINMADSVDQPLHVATATNELFKKAKAKGYSQHDMCAVYRAADV